MISIVTASYNYENYIKKTIQSVLNQTYTDWEMIIVDDCSTDNSVEVIKSFKDDRIKLFVNEKNLGLKGTVKRGVENAKGEWVVFLESDDMITPDYLEKKAAIIQKYPDINLIFNDCEFFGDEQKVHDFNIVFKKTRELLRKKKYPCNLFYEFYDSNKIFTFSSVAAKRSDLLKLDYNPNIDCILDWHLWIQLAYIGKFYYIPEKLTHWRLHTDSYIYKSKHSTPFDLQIKTYMFVFKKTHDFKIIPMIIILHQIWYAKKVKRTLRHLISQKRQASKKNNCN